MSDIPRNNEFQLSGDYGLGPEAYENMLGNLAAHDLQATTAGEQGADPLPPDQEQEMARNLVMERWAVGDAEREVVTRRSIRDTLRRYQPDIEPLELHQLGRVIRYFARERLGGSGFSIGEAKSKGVDAAYEVNDQLLIRVNPPVHNWGIVPHSFLMEMNSAKQQALTGEPTMGYSDKSVSLLIRYAAILQPFIR